MIPAFFKKDLTWIVLWVKLKSLIGNSLLKSC